MSFLSLVSLPSQPRKGVGVTSFMEKGVLAQEVARVLKERVQCVVECHRLQLDWNKNPWLSLAIVASLQSTCIFTSPLSSCIFLLLCFDIGFQYVGLIDLELDTLTMLSLKLLCIAGKPWTCGELLLLTPSCGDYRGVPLIWLSSHLIRILCH